MIGRALAGFAPSCVGCQQNFSADIRCCCDDTTNDADKNWHKDGFCLECCPKVGYCSGARDIERKDIRDYEGSGR